MGNDGIALGNTRSNPGLAAWIVEAAFVGFLLLVFIGVTPFATRDTVDTAIGASAAAGAGDMLRQICYLGVFAIILAGALTKRGISAFGTVPIWLAMLLVWCALTSLWAVESDVALRRAGLEMIVVLSVMLGVGVVGAQRSLKLLSYVLIAVLVVNWISIPLLPQAVHQSGDIEPEVVGDWRGLYFHKNIAGAVCALSVLLFLYYAITEKARILYLAFAAAAFLFLMKTHSKSSLGLLPVAITAAAIYRWGWRRDIDRAIVAVTGLLLVVAIATLVFVNHDAIVRALSDPEEFTGRAAIWQGELAFIADHPFTGSGFGTFADTGSLSPLHNYVGGWVRTVAQGHNGYLELAVTTGLVGFALGFLAFILSPARMFWARSDMDTALKTLYFALFVFLVLHNFMESDFLDGDGVAWITFLLVLAGLKAARSPRHATNPWQPA
jgi:exopolysaccharide production protein ExoQ